MTGPPSNSAIVVCGAGAAGMATALSAARQGASVHLVETTGQVGGTVAGSLIHTLGGLYDDAGQLMNHGLPAELVQRLCAATRSVRKRRMGRVWVQSACPNLYRQVVQQWLDDEPAITIHYQTRVTGVAQLRGQVTQVELAGPSGNWSLVPHAVIDTTGTAEVVRLIDPSLLVDDSRRAAGGWIFRVHGVPPGVLDFPHGVRYVRMLREAVATGQLPATCAHAWLDLGIEPDEIFVKLFVPLPKDWRQREQEIRRQAGRDQTAVMQFLRALPEFAECQISQVGSLGVRDGGRVRGRYWLAEDDVRQCRRFEDAACRASWPIEYWDPEDGVSMDYLPSGGYYEIPLRCLRLQRLDNVWVAGKCLSADRFAQASARVAGTCWAMGDAVGQAAARTRRDSPGADTAPAEPAAAKKSD